MSCAQLGEVPPAPRRRLRPLPAADPRRGSWPAVRGRPCRNAPRIPRRCGRSWGGSPRNTPAPALRPCPPCSPSPGRLRREGLPKRGCPLVSYPQSGLFGNGRFGKGGEAPSQGLGRWRQSTGFEGCPALRSAGAEWGAAPRAARGWGAEVPLTPPERTFFLEGFP